ncbi:MAG: NAD-dependent epimerase/dehydratase family protein [Lautropia sp.]
MKTLLAGARGTAGAGIAQCLLAAGHELVCLSRRPAELPGTLPCASPTHLPAGPPADQPGTRWVPLDLTDRDAIGRERAALLDCEALVFAAKIPGASPADEAQRNRDALADLVEAIDRPGGRLARVVLVHGTKWYGCHLGPYRVPAREDDPRGPPPLFYFDQYDWLRARRANRQWSMTTLRPHTVWGCSTGSGNNLVTLLAVYATLCRNRGLPLAFPGPVETYEKRSQATAAELLGDAVAWSLSAPAAADRDFNLTNGDTFRWRDAWPRFAAVFDLPAAGPAPGALRQVFDGADGEWASLVRAHGLRPNRLDTLASPDYGEALFGCTWDDVSSLAAARRASWGRSVDSIATLCALGSQLRTARVVP